MNYKTFNELKELFDSIFQLIGTCEYEFRNKTLTVNDGNTRWQFAEEYVRKENTYYLCKGFLDSKRWKSYYLKKIKTMEVL